MYRLILLFCSFLLLACEAEEAVMPAYRTEMADLLTDEQGRGVRILFDDGQTSSVINPPTQLPADTLYRVMTVFTSSDAGVRLANYQPVLTPHVRRFPSDQVLCDPVKFVAVSRAPHYLNLFLEVLGSTQGTHLFGIHEVEMKPSPTGAQTLCVQLLHDQHSDPAYFTRTVYLSIPLRPLDDRLQPGRDSIQLRVQLPEQEWCQTYPF